MDVPTNGSRGLRSGGGSEGELPIRIVRTGRSCGRAGQKQYAFGRATELAIAMIFRDVVERPLVWHTK